LINSDLVGEALEVESQSSRALPRNRRPRRLCRAASRPPSPLSGAPPTPWAEKCPGARSAVC